MIKSSTLMAALAMVCFSFVAYPQKTIEFFVERTVPAAGKTIQPYTIDFPDSVAGDTLYQVRAENGDPVSYYRQIKTSVCFDSKCRLLNIILHWNVTGRYLGFELPPDEFLSKAEHKPFVHSEYLRLHTLLADRNSPLAGFSYNELVPAKLEAVNPDVDAISAPTSKNLLEFVVEGAAYTTYKLWHIVHGPSEEEITKLTAEALSPDLLIDILNCDNISDKIWALSQRHWIKERVPEVQEIVLSFIGSDEYSLAERAVYSITSNDLADDDFQVSLVGRLDEVNYGLKKLIIQKFNATPQVSDDARLMLAEKLIHLDGVLIGAILDVFREKGITDIEVSRRVGKLLRNENVFISRQAFAFLNDFPTEDTEIQRELALYRAKHNVK